MKKVFTTGTFDVLHYGHVKLLEHAKALGDYLVVGLNSDELIAHKNPVYSYEQREQILRAIKYVDEVVPIHSQEDKYKYIDEIGINIFTIGSDYIGFSDISEIEKHTQVVFLERTPNVSTTKVKGLMVDEYQALVIDVDDTISTTINRDFANAIPHQEIINKINRLHELGWKIIFFTARGVKSCGYDLEKIEKKYREITETWLREHNVQYDELLFRKPNATYYIDDKNMSIEEFLTKDFPKVLQKE